MPVDDGSIVGNHEGAGPGLGISARAWNPGNRRMEPTAGTEPGRYRTPAGGRYFFAFLYNGSGTNAARTWVTSSALTS